MSSARATESRLRRQMAATCRRLAAGGLLPGTSGNVSCRIPAGMLVTPSGASAAALAPEELVAMDFDGNIAPGAGKPSSEWRMHARIYRRVPEAHAVVHAHADHCTAIACCRRGIPAFHYLVAAFGGAEVPCLPYAPFGTEALAASAAEGLAGRAACLLANHGAVCRGKSLAEAAARAELLELLARQYLLALQAGEPVLLDPEEMRRMVARMADYLSG
jgi:L-fuculose-phosphate aldolase